MNVDFSSFSFIKGNLSSEPIIPEKFPSQELLPLINQKKGGGDHSKYILYKTRDGSLKKVHFLY